MMWMIWLVVAAILVSELIVDHVPRFYQGDSVAYLSTTRDTMPADRSWLYGLGVHALLQSTQGYVGYIVIQAGLFLLVTMACAKLVAGGARSWPFAVFAVAVCLDPLLGIYQRFYMTDLLACLLFIVFLVSLCCGLRAKRAGFALSLLVMAPSVVLDVFVRVAYAPVILLTVLIIAVQALRYRQPVRLRLALVFCLPFMATGLLVAANGLVFAKRFPHEMFVNKLSGIMLLGTWAPAIDASDFRAAGVDVSDAQVAGLDLSNYDARGRQIWGEDETAARILIMHHIGAHDSMAASIDRACTRIVRHALFRNPIGMARVYAVTFMMQLDPRWWHGTSFDMESGITRTLPPGFVGWMNRLTRRPIAPSITQLRSPVFDLYRTVARAYPVLLGAGLVLALWRLLARRPRLGGLIAAAAFVAVLVTIPLFTVSVIPRYTIAAVFLQYLLWADVFANPRVPQPEISGTLR
jgi:hypothetical protein